MPAAADETGPDERDPALAEELELDADGAAGGRVTVSQLAARRTPRGTLSRQVLLDSAREIIDIGGVNALSMRALGARLGVDPTAVYRHFQNKNELLDALADQLVRGDEPLPATGDPGEDLRENLRQLRRQLLRYPTLAPSVLRQPPGSGSWWDRMEHAVGALLALGLDEREAAATWQTLLFFVLGHALTEARHLAETIAADRVGAPMPTVNPPRSRHPRLAAVAPYLHADLTEQFETGIDRILGQASQA
ncbi:MAG: TetR/AcrR family transcriptional regulator C-terminal domain-containing protein [Frankia sp.]|nr:TetR/AcrR family transcriptional regulator C-terminal domain-containing protein [Frankia sp.]